MVNSQNVGVVPGIFKNSISPVNKLELVPPRVKAPPGTSFWVLVWLERVSQNPISGVVSWPPVARACQNGIAFVFAIAEKARPKIPETEPWRRPWVVC